jgi:AcrR family transcriptional regulator
MPKRPPRRRTQRERSDATVAALVEAARLRFAADGFTGTAIDDILRDIGITRGALYHHFASKAELFRAVFEEQERRLTAAVVAGAEAAATRSAWPAFRAGCEAFLDACLDPSTQRIVLIDGPAVLGWEVVREIEERYVVALLRDGLARAIEAGALARRPIEPLADILIGALTECARSIARAPQPQIAAREARRELDRLLRALAKD